MVTEADTVHYDPSTPEFQEVIWDVYGAMRDRCPVYRDPGGAFFALSRFEDVWAAVHAPESFSNVVDEAKFFHDQLIYFDPPRHTELRMLVSRAFTPRRIAELEQLIRETARERIEVFAEKQEHDLQHGYAAVIPSVAIGRMIGVPEEHLESFRSWTESFLVLASQATEATANIYGLFSELLDERRRRPADDLMTALLAAEVDGQHLSPEQVLGFLLNLILGGNDTTSSLIGSGMVLLARHPDQRRLLLDDPSLWKGAIEEMIRIESPVQALPRTVEIQAEFQGVVIPEGSRLMLLWGAANHDDREFDDPERFDVRRIIPRHLAFGHGVHFCLGSNLARLEARVAFEEWFARFPDYELDGEPERVTSVWARAFSRIPVSVG